MQAIFKEEGAKSAASISCFLKKVGNIWNRFLMKKKKPTQIKYTCHRGWSSYGNFCARQHSYPTKHTVGTHFLVEQAHQLVNRQHAILTDGCEYLQPRDHEWTSDVFAEGRIPKQKHPNSCLSWGYEPRVKGTYRSYSIFCETKFPQTLKLSTFHGR